MGQANFHSCHDENVYLSTLQQQSTDHTHSLMRKARDRPDVDLDAGVKLLPPHVPDALGGGGLHADLGNEKHVRFKSSSLLKLHCRREQKATLHLRRTVSSAPARLGPGLPSSRR